MKTKPENFFPEASGSPRMMRIPGVSIVMGGIERHQQKRRQAKVYELFNELDRANEAKAPFGQSSVRSIGRLAL